MGACCVAAQFSKERAWTKIRNSDSRVPGKDRSVCNCWPALGQLRLAHTEPLYESGSMFVRFFASSAVSPSTSLGWICDLASLRFATSNTFTADFLLRISVLLFSTTTTLSSSSRVEQIRPENQKHDQSIAYHTPYCVNHPISRNLSVMVGYDFEPSSTFQVSKFPSSYNNTK
ncbi:predicted protein [Histoplasma capsulatum G186AR]|uniref:Uncharacterized protein n=1 Tax=Ajellomyces capsulatus (strain G186AR / H82 / ATCC MYA-2454 / RMSCC 2432) TaxID=447093 RepID=C0NDI6_AJECG|nr:uncharacterized protein HCBG_01929 [Histoplasma capsulatum G186AR]EEH10284.1 predicted protein [Histoplasma capsulatum G186AR]